MMRRRSPSWPDPKMKSRCKRSQQTEPVKEPAENEEKVLLDYLVLVKIASFTKLDLAPDICQELVSSAFANALRSSYSSKKVKLSIGALDSEDSEVPVRKNPNITLLSVSEFSQRWKEGINIKTKNLSRAIQQIFARYSRIALKLQDKNVGYMASVVSDTLSVARDVTIESLSIFSEFQSIMRCRELIEKLSVDLQVFNFKFEEDFTASSEKFWQTVSSCAKLVSFSVMVDEDDYVFEEGESLFKHISACLKLLKFKRFRTNLRVGSTEHEMKWLTSALAKNENLRHLDLECYSGHCCLNQFGDDEDVLLILSRLDSLKIWHTLYQDCESYDWDSCFGKILPALSNHAVLKVNIDLFVAKEDVEQSLFHVLGVYLALLRGTAKSIKLTAMYRGDHADGPLDNASDVFKAALDRLTSEDQDRSLQTTRVGSWTRILYGNANLLAKARIH